MTEATPQRPEDPYGIAKHAFELDLKSAARMFGLRYTIFRPHNVYGPRQNVADRFRNAVGIFMNQILRDEPLTIFGDGEQTRCFSRLPRSHKPSPVAAPRSPWVLARRVVHHDPAHGATRGALPSSAMKPVATGMGDKQPQPLPSERRGAERPVELVMAAGGGDGLRPHQAADAAACCPPPVASRT